MNKKDNSLISMILDPENLVSAFNQTQEGKSKYKEEAMKFKENESYNLNELRNKLLTGLWKFGNYTEFVVHEPKVRIINAPRYEAKIVQLAINNILKREFNKRYIFDSYACIDGKGNHKAVDRVSYFMRKAYSKYGEDAYIIKLDIRKFFYSINRDILKSILVRKIKCKETLTLIYLIIDSAEQIDELGLPLGNTLSQLFANVYMNELDQYCKRRLGVKYYIRYADDVIVFLENKEEANKILKEIKSFLDNDLGLVTNNHKTKIFPIEQGVNAYGYKIYRTHRLLRDDSKKKIKRKAKKFPRLIQEGKMTVLKVEQILNSWMGHAMRGDSHNFIIRLIKNNPYIYINSKGTLKVNGRIASEIALGVFIA